MERGTGHSRVEGSTQRKNLKMILFVTHKRFHVFQIFSLLDCQLLEYLKAEMFESFVAPASDSACDTLSDTAIASDPSRSVSQHPHPYSCTRRRSRLQTHARGFLQTGVSEN